MSSRIEANRLTDADRDAMTAKVREIAKCWHATHIPVAITDGEVRFLERAAYRVLGCIPYDLRDVEIAWTTDMVRVVVADVFALALVEVPA